MFSFYPLTAGLFSPLITTQMNLHSHSTERRFKNFNSQRKQQQIELQTRNRALFLNKLLLFLAKHY